MSKDTSILRALAESAARHPHIEQAVLGALRDVLPTVIEGILCQQYPGETVRLYVRKGRSSDERAARDLRIKAAGASGTPVALIAKHEGISERRVRQLIGAAA